MCHASRVSAIVALACLAVASAGCRKENPVVTRDTPEGTVHKENPVVVKDTSEGAVPDENPVVVMDTSEGAIRIELFADQAPKTVANFLQYVDDGFYDGTIFHRVIPTFMVQGGGFTPEMKQKATHAPVPNEAANGLRNLRGTLAMARTGDPHSATAQFFINVVDNRFLDHKAPTAADYGYCVFGRVIEGMNVVDRIKGVETHTVGPFENVPVTPVVINSIRRAETP